MARVSKKKVDDVNGNSRPRTTGAASGRGGREAWSSQVVNRRGPGSHTRIGTWNVRTMNEVIKLENVKR